jgi:hypothetical protein
LELLLFPVGLPIAQELTPTKSNIEAMGRPKRAAHGFIIFWGPRQRLLSRPFYIKPGHKGGSAEKNLIRFEYGRCWKD